MSLRSGVLDWVPVHAQSNVLPQRGHGILDAAPSSAVGIHRSTFTWQPGV
jgi:hypothetical protein